MVLVLMILISSLFYLSYGQTNAEFQFDDICYKTGDTLKLTATYTGTGSPTSVQWSQGGVLNQLIITASSCSVFGAVPVGFPDSSRLTYKCPGTDGLQTNEFKLEVRNLSTSELDATWGATFSPPVGSTPDPVEGTVPKCSEDTSRADGLTKGDIAAIILGILLILLALLTVVMCILFQKGYLGNREDQVLPLFPDIYTTPESLRQFSSDAIERSSQKRKYHYQEKDPIIYMHDDIYHPPKSRPVQGVDSRPVQYSELVPPIKVPRRHRSRRKRRHSSRSRQMTSSRSMSIASYPDDAVFISDKGGMKFTMFYETRSAYAEKGILSKTF